MIALSYFPQIFFLLDFGTNLKGLELIFSNSENILSGRKVLFNPNKLKKKYIWQTKYPLGNQLHDEVNIFEK